MSRRLLKRIAVVSIVCFALLAFGWKYLLSAKIDSALWLVDRQTKSSYQCAQKKSDALFGAIQEGRVLPIFAPTLASWAKLNSPSERSKNCYEKLSSYEEHLAGLSDDVDDYLENISQQELKSKFDKVTKGISHCGFSFSDAGYLISLETLKKENSKSLQHKSFPHSFRVATHYLRRVDSISEDELKSYFSLAYVFLNSQGSLMNMLGHRLIELAYDDAVEYFGDFPAWENAARLDFCVGGVLGLRAMKQIQVNEPLPKISIAAFDEMAYMVGLVLGALPPREKILDSFGDETFDSSEEQSSRPSELKASEAGDSDLFGLVDWDFMFRALQAVDNLNEAEKEKVTLAIHRLKDEFESIRVDCRSLKERGRRNHEWGCRQLAKIIRSLFQVVFTQSVPTIKRYCANVQEAFAER